MLILRHCKASESRNDSKMRGCKSCNQEYVTSRPGMHLSKSTRMAVMGMQASQLSVGERTGA